MSQCRAVPTSIFTNVLMIGMMALFLIVELRPRDFINQPGAVEMASAERPSAATDDAAPQSPDTSDVLSEVDVTAELEADAEAELDDMPAAPVSPDAEVGTSEPEVTDAAATTAPDHGTSPVETVVDKPMTADKSGDRDLASSRVFVKPPAKEATASRQPQSTAIYRGVEQQTTTYTEAARERWEVVDKNEPATAESPQPRAAAPSAQRTFATAIYRGTNREVTVFEYSEPADPPAPVNRKERDTTARPAALSDTRNPRVHVARARATNRVHGVVPGQFDTSVAAARSEEHAQFDLRHVNQLTST